MNINFLRTSNSLVHPVMTECHSIKYNHNFYQDIRLKKNTIHCFKVFNFLLEWRKMISCPYSILLVWQETWKIKSLTSKRLAFAKNPAVTAFRTAYKIILRKKVSSGGQ